MIKRVVIFLFLGLPVINASAQVMARSGTHFTFGIPEGPDAITNPFAPLQDTSMLLVNITSAYNGKGIITSPNGYCQEFTFTSNSATTLGLPFSFMHLNDLGKTNKGILIKTSQPVNVVFHNFFPDAGEATQIYPDEALDTDYRVTTWGIYNDSTDNEDNHTQFLITATQDSTDVTIVPSVLSLGNHPAHIPIQITLNKGECYIVKADTFGVPYDASLSNSTVHTSKPVSIIAALTCGYNPLGVESCDELLDEVLPKKYTDTIFYVVPLLDTLVTNTVLFTSDTPDFFVFSSNGSNVQAINGRAQIDISRARMFSVTAPAQCFLLSQGSEVQNEGDPSIVTILPRSQYGDTMVWFTPAFNGQIQFQPGPFLDYVSVVYPKAFEGQVMLDGVPIASQATPQTIVGSAMAGIVDTIQPGVHLLTSPVPIFATVSGFADADGYSFLPGTISPKLPEDTVSAMLSIAATPAGTCRTFDAIVSTSFHSQNDIKTVDLIVTYDPAILTLLSVKLGPAAQGGQWITDTRTQGIVTISASCLQAFSDSDAIAFLTFATGPAVTATTVTANIEEIGVEGHYSTIAGIAKKIIDIQEIRDTLKASFALDAGTSHFGDYDTAAVHIVSMPNEAASELDLFVSYNHDLMSLQFADLRNTVIPGITTILPMTVDPLTDEIIVPIKPPILLPASGIIARLIFKTYISDSSSGNIGLRAVVGNTRPCPLDILSDQISSEFIGNDTCGTQELRSIMLHESFVITSVIPNPSNGNFTISLDRHLFGEPLHVSLVDMLGNEVWGTYHSSPDIHEKIPCTLEHSIPNGSYLIRIAGSGKTITEKIVIRN